MLTFEQFYESVDAEGNRVGVQHLYSDYKPDLYSMSFEGLQLFMDILKSQKSTIAPGNSFVSEKADGMSVKFGLNEKDEFYLQSSYSGPVYDGSFEGKIKHEPTKKVFEKEFDVIKNLTYSILKKSKKRFGLPSIRVQCEWLYSPFAIPTDNSEDMVYFVATNYYKDKLGTWSTFPIITITDNEGNEIDNHTKDYIIEQLSNLSNRDIKFIDLNVTVFPEINMQSEVNEYNALFRQFQAEHPDYKTILSDPSRKREQQQAKKQIRSKLLQLFLPLQKKMHQKIQHAIKELKGILGEYEGIVIKPSKDSQFAFKVISPSFHKNKGREL